MNEKHLEYNEARQLAETLKSIPGFPWDERSLDATAHDLIRWCKGRIMDGYVATSHDQALWLVTEAREKWTKWLGTSALREMFVHKYYAPPPLPDWSKEGPADMTWPAEYLKAAVRVVDKAQDWTNQKNALRWQAIRDSLYYTEGGGQASFGLSGDETKQRREAKRFDRKFWSDAIRNLTRDYPEEVSAIRAGLARGELTPIPPLPQYEGATDDDRIRKIVQADIEAIRRERNAKNGGQA